MKYILDKESPNRNLITPDWSSLCGSAGFAELRLSYYYNILHFHQDFRGDEWDDAGYIVSISELKGKYYLHILFISCNNFESDTWNISHNSRRPKNDYNDFKEFYSVEDAQKYLNSLIEKMKDFEEPSFEELYSLEGEERIEVEFMRTLMNPFFDYEKEERYALENLSKNNYKYKYYGYFFEWDGDYEGWL